MNTEPDPALKTEQNIPPYIVGIGASAGGLQAIESFFDNMPSNSGLAFVVVQHLSPDFKSLMDELLARHTQMAIHKVTDRLTVEPNSVYLIPPEQDMALSNGKLLLTDQDSHRGLNLPIDIFFKSLARELGERGICIVMSGTGSDGSRGLVDVHEAGGLVMVQNEESASFDGMPRAAIKTGKTHVICPPAQMPSKILEYIADPNRETVGRTEADSVEPTTSENALFVIFRRFRHEFGIDFSLYKPATIHRRIERRIQMTHSLDLKHYAQRLEDDRDELDTLYRDLLVEVTQFFRDPKAFERLRREIIPKIVDSSSGKNELRVWVPGCATGEEAYSLAILFHDALLNARRTQGFKVFATDVHKRSLETASIGVYSSQAIEHVPAEFRSRYFNVNNGLAHVTRELRQSVIFAANDLTKDPPFTKIDLISCRNVLIYFEPKVQKRILSMFHFGLVSNGVLMLGPSETLADLESEFEPLDRNWRIFRKQRDVRLPDSTRMPLTPALSNIVHDHGPSFVASPPTAGASYLVSNVYEDLLLKYVPPSLLVNRFYELVHSFGDARKLLTQPEGKPTLDVLKLLGGELRIAVSAALHKAGSEKRRVVYPNIRVTNVDEPHRYFSVVVEPYTKTTEQMFLICLEESERNVDSDTEESDVGITDDASDRINHLERELTYTRETLQATVEELESSNEELQSTNEELIASNEELQSTNEELHSVNEELYTVNAEHKQKIEELTQMSNDMDNLLKSTKIGTIFLDRNFKIRMFTPAITAAFNVMPLDIGRPIDHIAYKLDNPNLLAEVASVLNTENSISVEVKAKGGRIFLQRIQPYIQEDGEVDGIVLTLTDITALREAEAMVSLTGIAEELPSFAYAVSHDFQSPLRHIEQYSEILSELLQEQETNAEIDQALAYLRTSALSIRKLMNCLLEYSRINTRGEPFTAIDMDLLLKDFLTQNDPFFQKHDVHIAAMELPTIFGDRKHLTLLLSHLLKNAVLYNDRKPNIRINCNRQGDFWEFSILDNGIGIDDEHRDDVFTIFKRLGVKEVDGQGLGLALCRRIVARHGGRIWLTSEMNVGTTVSFTLPVGTDHSSFDE